MTKDEIEKLAQAYAGQHETRCKENQFHLAISFMELRAAFIAGYLKGVEMERKRCLEICELENSTWNNLKLENREYAAHVVGRIQMASDLKEQIEASDD